MGAVLGPDLGWSHCICFTIELIVNKLLHWYSIAEVLCKRKGILREAGNLFAVKCLYKCINIITGSTGFRYPCTWGQSRSVSLLLLSAAFLLEALPVTRCCWAPGVPVWLHRVTTKPCLWVMLSCAFPPGNLALLWIRLWQLYVRACWWINIYKFVESLGSFTPYWQDSSTSCQFSNAW